MKLEAAQRLQAAFSWLSPSLYSHFKKVQAGDEGNLRLLQDAGRELGRPFKSDSDYWNFLCQTYSGPSIDVTRVLYLPDASGPTLRKLRAKPGVHWSSKLLNIGEPMSKQVGTLVRIWAKVKKSDVDLKTTVEQRIWYPEEQETTLKSGAVPNIISIIDAKTKAELWPKREVK